MFLQLIEFLRKHPNTKKNVMVENNRLFQKMPKIFKSIFSTNKRLRA